MANLITSHKGSTSKKGDRPSPSDSATIFKTGTTKKGNDGNMWTVVETDSGVKRWKAISRIVTTGKKSYFIHDNGGRPFLVYLGKQTAEIYKLGNSDKDHPTKADYTKLVKQYDDVEKIFIGKSPMNDMTRFSGGHGAKFDGNSILIKLSKPENRYVFIGERIYEFTAPEQITQYFSSVGNSDVPYPVALSKNFAYFMIGPSMHYKEKQKLFGEYVDKTLFPKGIDWSDAYTTYYELFPQLWYKDRKGKTNQFSKGKMIHKRMW